MFSEMGKYSEMMRTGGGSLKAPANIRTGLCRVTGAGCRCLGVLSSLSEVLAVLFSRTSRLTLWMNPTVMGWMSKCNGGVFLDTDGWVSSPECTLELSQTGAATFAAPRK